MKILFSPAEDKISFSDLPPINSKNFIFNELHKKRFEILKLYDNFVQNAAITELSRVFGLKKETEILQYKNEIFKSGTIKAILRYNGVAYKALQYRSLNKQAQNFIDKNVIIFSNLFGPILAENAIPNYKLKQGEKFCDINVENFYKQNFSEKIDKLIENDDILDLRAGFYNKFYDIKKEYLTMKFIKNGKVISHFAKYFRGKILKEIAQNQLDNNKKIIAFNFTDLKLIEIHKIQNRTEILYKII